MRLNSTYLAPGARGADRTNTFELANHVDALAAVATRRTRTLVDVGLAVATCNKKRLLVKSVDIACILTLSLTGVAGRTGTMVVVDQIDAGAAVPALAHRTVVQILGARLATPALLALALEAAGRIVAGHRIDARSQRSLRVHLFVGGALVEICPAEHTGSVRSG